VPTRARIRTVALPTEHGGWGLTLEPVALGLLVAPSLTGAFLALAAVAAFLARHPLKIVAGDRRRRQRRFPRTALAEKFALLYSLIAAASFVGALLTAADHKFLYVVAFAAPFAAVQLYFDGVGHSRKLLPELAGSIAMAATAACVALAAGWTLAPALALSAVLAARFLPSIIYVRAMLTRLHGKTVAPLPPIIAHVAGLACVVALVVIKLLPLISLLPFTVMLLRCARGLYAPREDVTARRIGFGEIGYGTLTVLLIAAGQQLGF
jgi:hypothetical protein